MYWAINYRYHLSCRNYPNDHIPYQTVDSWLSPYVSWLNLVVDDRHSSTIISIHMENHGIFHHGRYNPLYFPVLTVKSKFLLLKSQCCAMFDTEIVNSPHICSQNPILQCKTANCCQIPIMIIGILPIYTISIFFMAGCYIH